jgi:hypothetical protein
MLLQRVPCPHAPTASGARLSTEQLLRRVPCRKQPFVSGSGDQQHSRAQVVSSVRPRFRAAAGSGDGVQGPKAGMMQPRCRL